MKTSSNERTSPTNKPLIVTLPWRLKQIGASLKLFTVHWQQLYLKKRGKWRTLRRQQNFSSFCCYFTWLLQRKRVSFRLNLSKIFVKFIIKVRKSCNLSGAQHCCVAIWRVDFLLPNVKKRSILYLCTERRFLFYG